MSVKLYRVNGDHWEMHIVGEDDDFGVSDACVIGWGTTPKMACADAQRFAIDLPAKIRVEEARIDKLLAREAKTKTKAKKPKP